MIKMNYNESHPFRTESALVGIDGLIIGGEYTFGNSVIVPPRVVTGLIPVIVAVSGLDSIHLLPNRTFRKSVEVILSYAPYIPQEGKEPKICTFAGGEWVEVEGVVYDRQEKTGAFKTAHFTRYGWGF